MRKVAFGRHRPTGRPLESSGPVPAPTGPPSPPHVNARAADLWTYIDEALTGSKRASGQGENHQVLDRRFNQCVLPRRFRGLGGRVCGCFTATGIGRSGRRLSRSGIDPSRHRRVRAAVAAPSRAQPGSGRPAGLSLRAASHTACRSPQRTATTRRTEGFTPASCPVISPAPGHDDPHLLVEERRIAGSNPELRAACPPVVLRDPVADAAGVWS